MELTLIEAILADKQRLKLENKHLHKISAIMQEEIAGLQAEIERLRAALQEIEFHGGPAAAVARAALEPKP